MKAQSRERGVVQGSLKLLLRILEWYEEEREICGRWGNSLSWTIQDTARKGLAATE